jgi:hypothetical protein
MLEPAKEGDGAGININLEPMIAKFYILTGLDEEKGIASEELLRKLKVI